jgi:hypothetical protein
MVSSAQWIHVFTSKNRHKNNLPCEWTASSVANNKNGRTFAKALRTWSTMMPVSTQTGVVHHHINRSDGLYAAYTYAYTSGQIVSKDPDPRSPYGAHMVQAVP